MSCLLRWRAKGELVVLIVDRNCWSNLSAGKRLRTKTQGPYCIPSHCRTASLYVDLYHWVEAEAVSRRLG